MRYVNPVLPAALATILPLFDVPEVGLVTVPVTVIVTPVQGLGAMRVKLAVPIQPLASFASMVYAPTPRLVKLPDAW